MTCSLCSSVSQHYAQKKAQTLLVSLALKCDLREDRQVMERLAQFGMHTVQYEEGLAVARRIRASRYLGAFVDGDP